MGEHGGDRTFTGLCPQMWEGATVPIPAEALRSTDGDSGPQDLVYTIEQPSNGRVVLRTAPDAAVHHFTQAQLDSRLVLFSHTGESSGLCSRRGCPEVGTEGGTRLGPGGSAPPCPQEPWMEASASTSLTGSTLPPDTSSAWQPRSKCCCHWRAAGH